MNEAGERWLSFADQDLKMAELPLSEGIYNQVCFHSHQCIEKCIKAKLADINIRPPRTHSIVDLLGLLPQHFFQELGEELEQIDVYYLPTRYPDALPGSLPDGLPGQRDAEQAIALARACSQEAHKSNA